MSRRGRAAALPDGPHQRPAVLDENGLVVRHRDAQGRVRSYAFGALPVPKAFGRSLAALYAAKCAPGGGWDSIETSEAHWYLAEQHAVVRALPYQLRPGTPTSKSVSHVAVIYV